MKSTTQGQHSFAVTPKVGVPRSTFDMSRGYKTAFDAGYLVPFFRMDVLPGDTVTANVTAVARLSTPAFPFMDNMYMDFHFFFVPDRQIWDNARKFYGEQVDPGDSIDYTLPVFSTFTPGEDTLHDYLELPITGNSMSIQSKYHRGYNHIYNHWFRDQNLQDSVHVDTDDGPDTESDYVLLRRGKRHDYFTSALPFLQKGDPVYLPLSGEIPVKTDTLAGVAPISIWSTESTARYETMDTAGDLAMGGVSGAEANRMYVDLEDQVSATISDLREAVQIQKLLERDARAGTRYPEVVKNHFGVDFYDIAYRPEFLGSGSTPIKSTPVASTAYNSLTSPASNLGDLGAFATAMASGIGFSKSFVEHGFILGLVSTRADYTYQEGMPKEYLKSTRYDIYWPSLAHLSEQEVLNGELYWDDGTARDGTFGFQERHAEYRYMPSRLTGAFRSTHSASLDAWHLAQEFGSVPVLGPTFIVENPPVDRIIEVPTEPHFIFDSYISCKAARPLPVFGVPGMMDHF